MKIAKKLIVTTIFVLMVASMSVTVFAFGGQGRMVNQFNRQQVADREARVCFFTGEECEFFAEGECDNFSEGRGRASGRRKASGGCVRQNECPRRR